MARVVRLTPEGVAALAVIRIEGEEEASRLRALTGELPPPGRMPVRELCLPGSGLREKAVLLALPDRSGYELHVHGNPVLVRAVLAELGGRSDSGERPDLRSEILAAATRVSSREGLRWCLLQLSDEGLWGLARALASSRGEMANLGPSSGSMVKPRAATDDLNELAVHVDLALKAGHWLQRLLAPVRVVLRGRVNVGKSTLFNMLVGRERVRTGPARALTRDPIEEEVLLEGLPIRLVDTAGQAEDLSGLDGRASERARHLASGQVRRLWVGSLIDPAPEEGQCFARIWTHADRAERHPPEVGEDEPCVDLLAEDREGLRCRIARYLVTRLGYDDAAPAPGSAWLNHRQETLLRDAKEALSCAEPDQVRELGRRLLEG